MSHFLCISFTKINHLETRPPYLGAISNKFLSMVKNENDEVIVKTCIKKSYLWATHGGHAPKHQHVNPTIGRRRCTRTSCFYSSFTSWWKLWNNIQYDQRWYDLCFGWHVHYLKINGWFDWQHLWKIRTTTCWNQLHCQQELLNPQMKSSMK